MGFIISQIYDEIKKCHMTDFLIFIISYIIMLSIDNRYQEVSDELLIINHYKLNKNINMFIIYQALDALCNYSLCLCCNTVIFMA